MGKSGDLLRQKKKAEATYTFTGEQLKQHDDFIIERQRKQLQAECDRVIKEANEKIQIKTAEINKQIDAEWDKRFLEFCDRKEVQELIMEVMSLYLVTSADVLCSEFGFTPIPKKGAIGRNRLARFTEILVDKLNVVLCGESIDLKKYNDECYEKFGLKFRLTEVGEGQGGDIKNGRD